MFKRILVATDGSELADKAVARAIELAAEQKAELTAFTVVRIQPKSYMEGSTVVEAAEIDRIASDRTVQARSMLEAIETRAKSAGVRISTAMVKSNRVADSIVEAAQTGGCDLIVMATHGRTGLTRAVLGSETAHVLANSDAPVLVLR
jgi:nucleotide-binding universal stress UspA family protein